MWAEVFRKLDSRSLKENAALDLAKQLGSELYLITVIEELPAYAGYIAEHLRPDLLVVGLRFEPGVLADISAVPHTCWPYI